MVISSWAICEIGPWSQLYHKNQSVWQTMHMRLISHDNPFRIMKPSVQTIWWSSSFTMYRAIDLEIWLVLCFEVRPCWGEGWCEAQVPYNIIYLDSLRPRQNGRHFADDTFKRIFLNENVRTSIKISLKFVPEGPINNNPALVQIMAWHRSGNKPLSEPMMISLLMHICVTRPQWVKAWQLWIN